MVEGEAVAECGSGEEVEEVEVGVPFLFLNQILFYRWNSYCMNRLRSENL